MSPAPISRRTLVRGAGAALGASALAGATSTAFAAASPPVAAPGAPELDVELFDLLARRVAARAVFDQAADVLDVAEEVVQPVRDAMPAAIWHDGGDFCHDLGRPSGRRNRGGCTLSFYTGEDVEQLRTKLPLTRRLRPGAVEPDEKGEARRQAIIAAHDTWAAAMERAELSTGYAEAIARADAAWNALADLEDAILAWPARTVSGLIAKAALVVDVTGRRGIDGPQADFAREVAAFGEVRT